MDDGGRRGGRRGLRSYFTLLLSFRESSHSYFGKCILWRLSYSQPFGKTEFLRWGTVGSKFYFTSFSSSSTFFRGKSVSERARPILQIFCSLWWNPSKRKSILQEIWTRHFLLLFRRVYFSREKVFGEFVRFLSGTAEVGLSPFGF